MAVITCAAAAMAALHLGDTANQCWVIFSYAERGWELIYGIKDMTVAFSMPLLSIFATFLDFDPGRLLAAVSTALLLIVICAYNLGRLKGGWAGGTIYALTAAAVSLSLTTPHDPEQVFFTLLIMLYLNLEAAREVCPGPAASLLAGLALGGTLLVRSTLFFFPLVIPALELAREARPRKALLKEAAFFLLGAYMLLLPWARLNHFNSGNFTPFERGRGDSNMITGALGSIYTMEGNPRALAGLAGGDSIFKWAVVQVAKHPVVYMSAVAKRVWHIFFMHPLLFLLAALSLLYLRKGRGMALPALVLYFIVMHSLMSIEVKYFYSLTYLLGLLISGGICAALKVCAAKEGSGVWAARLLFLPALLFFLAVEYIVLIYPSKTSGDGLSGVETAQAKRPLHPLLMYKKAEHLIFSGRSEEGLAILRELVRLADGKKYSNAADILRIMDSPRPDLEHVEFIGSQFSEKLLKGLRELELKQEKEARRELMEEYLSWSRHNVLRGTPYQNDQVIQREMLLTNPDFQDLLIYEALLYWPPARRVVILDRLAGIFPLSAKLDYLRFFSLPSGTAAKRKALAALAAKPGFIKLVEPADFRSVVEQLSKAAIPLKAGSSSGRGGPGAAMLALLKESDSGLREKAALDYLEYTQEELLLIAGPRLHILCRGLGKVKELKGMQDPLILGFSGGIADAGRNPGLFMDATAIYLGLGKKEAAAMPAASAPALSRDAQALRRAAQALQDSGSYTQALQAINKAAAAAPGRAEILNDRGVILILLGRTADAEKDIIEALRLEQDNWEAGMNLAALRVRAGRKDEAEAIYGRLLTLRGLPAPVRKMLSKAN